MNLYSKLISNFCTKNLLSSSISSSSSNSFLLCIRRTIATTKIDDGFKKFLLLSSPIIQQKQQQEQQQYFNTNLMNYRKFTTQNSKNSVLCSKFTVRDPHHTVIPAGFAETLPLTEDRAYEVLLSLNESEFNAVKSALERYEAKKIKEGFEGQLAATRWRSRFGRPAKMPALGDVDPSGSYCAVPADWLRKKSVERAKPPESKDLWKIFLVNAVPFIGFGFLDNFTMIIAGDYIENIFGMFMCISTMAAAGLGNTISDILGIGSAYYIEGLCEMLGLKPPELTPIQLEMKSSRRSANTGRIFGITLGCVIGMFPLLFMESKKPPSSEQEEKNKIKN